MRNKFPLGPRLRITCSQETITKAVSTDSTRCWISESIKAQVPGAVNVASDLATIRFTDKKKGLRYVYLTPYTAQRALIDFDEGNPPAPFSFDLKNAHVTRAGFAPTDEDQKDSTGSNKAKERHNRKRRQRRRTDFDKDLQSATLITQHGNASGQATPRRVGGKRPPQLRILRQFGVRAFRGASKKRLESDAALIARADNGE